MPVHQPFFISSLRTHIEETVITTISYSYSAFWYHSEGATRNISVLIMYFFQVGGALSESSVNSKKSPLGVELENIYYGFIGKILILLCLEYVYVWNDYISFSVFNL